MIKANTPAINCEGTMSTLGYFLTTNIKTANEIGIKKAAILPVIWPGHNDPPTINKIPEIAKIIDTSVINEIFSLRKKYPKIARKIVCV